MENNSQEQKTKIPLSGSDIAAMIILFLLIFIIGSRVLLRLMNSVYTPEWLLGARGFFTVLTFDAIWLIAMKFWSSKDLKYRAYLTVLVFALSSAVLFCGIVLNLLSNIW